MSITVKARDLRVGDVVDICAGALTRTVSKIEPDPDDDGFLLVCFAENFRPDEPARYLPGENVVVLKRAELARSTRTLLGSPTMNAEDDVDEPAPVFVVTTAGDPLARLMNESQIGGSLAAAHYAGEEPQLRIFIVDEQSGDLVECHLRGELRQHEDGSDYATASWSIVIGPAGTIGDVVGSVFTRIDLRA